MKIAKAMAFLFAAVLVVVGFNSTVVFADHPWDEDGSGIDGGSTLVIIGENNPDTIIIINDPNQPETEEGYSEEIINPIDPGIIMNLYFFFFFYHDLPGPSGRDVGGLVNGLNR